MVEDKSVVILGAGAMGGMYASIFYDLNPGCVALAASGERCQNLKADGLVVNGRHYPIAVLSPQDEALPADLVIVALKHHHLPDALEALHGRVGERTVILSVMNGLDSEAIIGSVYGEDKTLYAIAVGTDPRRQGNTIQYNISGTIYFGEVENRVLTDRVKRVKAILDWAGLQNQVPEDMIRTLWWKFMINVGTNQASAVLAAPYKVFQTSTHAQTIMESAMREAIACAKAANVDLVEEDIADWYAFMNRLHPDGRTSMLQDIEAGRATEVEIFGGKVIELGKTYGVPTPVNEVLYHAIKVLEAHPG